MAFCVAAGLFLRPEVYAVGKPNQTPNVVAVAIPVLDGDSAMKRRTWPEDQPRLPGYDMSTFTRLRPSSLGA